MNYMAAARRCAWPRKSCWASAAGGFCERWGSNPEVCHLNEGHAAFAILERASDFMKATGQPFEVALQVTRAGNLFTTHTPVEAGFDRFPPDLVWQHLGKYAENQLGLSYRDLMALGRQDPGDDQEPFNMAYLALHGSGAVNGVSQLHGKVSRSIFQPLFPRWPQDEVPIGHVTNGIHVPTWDSRLRTNCGPDTAAKTRWLGETDQVAESIWRVSDQELWAMRQASRHTLVEYARQRYARQLAASGRLRGGNRPGRTDSGPGGLDPGFCPAVCHLQASHFAAARPGALAPTLNGPPAPCPDPDRRQGPSR